MKRKLFLFFVSICLEICCISQFESMAEQLPMKSSKTISTEKVYVLTDKSIYRPGETIWFMAFVTSMPGNIPSADCHTMYVKLVNNKGVPVFIDKFKVDKGRSNGYYSLPVDLADGRYALVAYSENTGDCANVFIREIFIKNGRASSFLMNINMKDGLFYPKQSINAFVNITDLSKQPLKDVKFKFLVKADQKEFFTFKGKTDEKGQAPVSFQLPEKIPSGEFTINILAKYKGFDQEITQNYSVVSDGVNIIFSPEGGQLVRDLESRVSFKASDIMGQPMNFEGELVDGNNKVITKIVSAKGLGSFTFIPQKDNVYSVRISNPSGISKSFNLPKVEDEGVCLAVEKSNNDSVFFRMKVSPKFVGTASSIVVKPFDVPDGQADISIKVILQNNLIVSLPKNINSEGLVNVTVVDSNKNVLSHRLAFVQPQKHLNITVKTDKPSYMPSEAVNLILKVTDEKGSPVSANLAMSVVSKNRILSSFHLQNIVTSTYLPADINPTNISFSNQSIDNLIMTYPGSGVARKAQKMNAVAGHVIDVKNNPVPFASIHITNFKTGRDVKMETDKAGRFSVVDSLLDPNFCNVTAVKEGSEKFGVVINNNFREDINQYVSKKLTAEDQWNIEADPNFFAGEKDVANRTNDFSIDKQRTQAKISTDKTILDMIREVKPYSIINNKIVFPGGINSINAQGGALIVVDGVKQGEDISVLKDISVIDIASLNVSTSLLDIQKYTGLNSVGVIEITTKRGEYKPGTTSSASSVPDTYSVPDKFPLVPCNSSVSDLKKLGNITTNYWNPEIHTDKNGEANLSFCNSDLIGPFLGILEGIDDRGAIGSSVFSFDVK